MSEAYAIQAVIVLGGLAFLFSLVVLLVVVTALQGVFKWAVEFWGPLRKRILKYAKL